MAVLQAITIALTLRLAKCSTILKLSSRTSCGVFMPYGALAESPKYIMRSFGIASRSSRTTEIPPSPESNTPIGAHEDIKTS